jgi:exodeoxyribonuclease VII small subunit
MKQTIAELQTELESIIAWFESEDVDIDKAVAKYEQGLALANELKKRLKEIDNSITKLKIKFDE